MLEFDFMRRKLAVSLMLSIAVPLIGIIMVNRRPAMVGDALSHTSLAGVGLGLILGFDPILGAIAICIVAAFSIESIRKYFPQFGDMATAVTMSAGLGFAVILSDIAPGGSSFETYLFGSISSVTSFDVISTAVVFVLVLASSIIFYGGLLDIVIDGNLARLSGVNVKLVNGLFTLLAAVTIALACKVVGALLVASLIVLPVATSLIVSKSYKQAFLLSVLLGVIYTMLGVSFSYYFNIRPGGAIVANAVIGMLLFLLFKAVRKKLKPSSARQIS